MPSTANFVQIAEPVYGIGNGLVFIAKEFADRLQEDIDLLYDVLKGSPFSRQREALYRFQEDIGKLLTAAREVQSFKVEVSSRRTTKPRAAKKPARKPKKRTR